MQQKAEEEQAKIRFKAMRVEGQKLDRQLIVERQKKDQQIKRLTA